MRNTIRRGAWGLIALSLAACGSTVPVTQRAAGGREFGGASDTTMVTADSGGEAAATGLSGATAGAVKRTAKQVAPGASTKIGAHDPIKIGVGVDSNDAAFTAAFGVNTSQPEEKDVATAIVADINRAGGLAGHRLDPVYGESSSTSNDWVAEDQAMCETFTRDNHVVAAIRTNDLFGPLDACLASAHVPLVLYESVFRNQGWFRAAPGMRFTPDGPSAARLYAALTERLVATKRWTPTTKIGIVRYDRSDQETVEREGLRAALAAHGIPLTDSASVHTPEGFEDIGATTSEIPAVILRFRREGIDHVVFQGGDLSYLFANAAQAQSYKPAYALTSFDFPNGMPTDQLHNAYGVGWEPTDDLTTPLPPTLGVARCQKATAALKADYAGAGVDRIYIVCDQLYFLEAAYNAAGEVGPGALAAGAKRLAAHWSPAFTFLVDGGAHPDGVAAVRDLYFDEGCACLKYGAQFPLP